MLYFIVNETSRSGKSTGIWQQLQDALAARAINYKAWKTEYEGHALELAREICQMQDDDICLVVVGGDGTINEVINGINVINGSNGMSGFERVRLGVIPTGSGNDFARGLKILGTPVQNLERILNCIEKGSNEAYVIDLGQVSWEGCEKPRLFAISAGMGLDALVCKKALTSKIKKFLNKIHLGKLTYLILTVQSLFSMETTEAAVHFDGKGQTNLNKVIFLAAMNFRAEGGGVPMVPDAVATDGKLSVCTVWGIPKWRTFFCLPFLVAAKHLWIRGFDVTNCVEFAAKTKSPMVLHADGEYLGDVTDVKFTCLPGKLRMLE